MALRHFPPVYSPLSAASLVGTLVGHARGGMRVAGHAYTTATREAVAALHAHVPGRSFVLTDSGTSALALALAAAASPSGPVVAGGCGAGTTVALPAYCCPDVATAAIANTMQVMLYDLDPQTLAPDWDSLRGCLERGATIVVVAHLFGRIVDIPQALSLTEQYGATLIEDAAQGAGGGWHGRPAASLAPIAVMSFGRGKGCNAGGGGALSLSTSLTEAGEGAPALLPVPLAPATRTASLLAWARAASGEALASPLLYGIPAALPFLGIGDTVYHAPTSPRGMSFTSASLLPAVLHRQPRLAQRRRAHQAWLRERLSGRAGLLFAGEERACTPGALRLPVRLDPVQGATLAPFGVARSYPRTLADYAAVRPWLATHDALPGARELASCVHTLPTHDLLTDRDRERLAQAIERR